MMLGVFEKSFLLSSDIGRKNSGQILHANRHCCNGNPAAKSQKYWFSTLFLKLGWIKLHWVQGLSDFLVANLGFFFVPPGVALMLYFDVIAAEFWPIVIATIVSTALVLVVTGWVHQIVRKFRLARQIKLARKLHLPDLHLSDRLRLKDKINLMNKDK